MYEGKTSKFIHKLCSKTGSGQGSILMNMILDDGGDLTNMVFDVYNSHTLFTHSNPKQVYLEAIIELNYKPNTWYIK